MTDVTALTGSFPPPDAAAWRALVEKTLKGEPLESLNRTTVEGLPIAPLYPADAQGATLSLPPRNAERPWDLRVPVAHPDPAAANLDLLADLQGGAASAVVRIDASGARGTAVGSGADLALVLKDVILELAPIGLDAGFLGPKAADWLAAQAKGSPSARLLFHMDPLSAFAASGESPGPVESHIVSASTVAARLAEVHPQAGLFLASGRVVHEAGGGEAAELAFAASAAVAYAKGMVRAGISMERAWNGVVLGLSADTDYFAVIAKLRAARILWARLTSACGVDTPARIEAASSRRMLSVQDPWTNMLRLGAAGFGAAVGGADAVMLGGFTDAIGLATPFARRQSRNTQLVLMEEAHLGRVADPAAGSGYVEALTSEIAQAAWAEFQAIEARGGLIEALEAGVVADSVARARKARDEAGALRIVGVTAFPPTQEAPVEVVAATARAADAPSPRLPGPDGRCPALSPIRLAEPYEVAK